MVEDNIDQNIGTKTVKMWRVWIIYGNKNNISEQKYEYIAVQKQVSLL